MSALRKRKDVTILFFPFREEITALCHPIYFSNFIKFSWVQFQPRRWMGHVAYKNWVKNKVTQKVKQGKRRKERLCTFLQWHACE